MSKYFSKFEKILEKWKKTTLKESVSRYTERKNKFDTISGFEIKNLYTPFDYNDEQYLKKLGFPGEYPFTRGIRPTMYRGRHWTMRMYSGFGTAEDTNNRYKYLLHEGQTGLSVAFDLPTQIGYDSDHPMSEGEVGRVGVAIDSLADMEILFDGIPLNKVSTNMTINSTAIILLAMYMCVGEKQGVEYKNLTGTCQNDVLKEYVARGTYIFPPKESLRIASDIFAYCAEHVPKWNTISICGYHIREAGSDAVQELGFTLANAIEYVKAGIEAGLDVDKFAKRISFHLDTHNNFLEEIAKYRAARRMWAKIMKERFGAKEDSSCMFRVHAQGAGCSLTRQQPENNIVRTTIQALAGALGGAQSLQTNAQDEAYAIPTEKTVRTALRTQQIIAYESGISDFVDPLGGAYAIECLTDELEKAAFNYIDKIDSMGGTVKAIENGYIDDEISESAYKYQISIEKRENIIVGLNKFKIEEPPLKDITRINYEGEIEQKRKLDAVKKKRNQKKVKQALDGIKKAAATDVNLFPSVLDAVKKYATVGEISDAMRSVFGEFRR